MPLHPLIAEVTERIRARSLHSRRAYLQAIRLQRARTPHRASLSCGNLAHVSAAAGPDRQRLNHAPTANLAIVSAYNDMLSAHRPYEYYPEQIRRHARALGACAQMAGGVPAMCDGITQGRGGMDLSLFSRDVIAQATAVALAHDAFDGAVYLGICDKIVPGLLIGALAFGHLPAVFIPSGPMPSGIANKHKAAVRERHAAGEASREELLAVESASYHAPGTCTFYGTANSNQVLLEAMGLQLPGAAFVPPDTPLRDALTRAAVERALRITTLGDDHRPLATLVDERSLVNAISALVATGGSTNHTIHFIAVARAAGILMTWEDIDAIARAVPLIARIYPNGDADVNRFAAVGGTAFIFRELLDAGLMHADIASIMPDGMRSYTTAPALEGDALIWTPIAANSGDDSVLRPVATPFEPFGGLRLMRGNLGRGLMKLSALAPEHRSITAPAVVVDNPQALSKLHTADALPRDFIAVVRFQGPHANGMPEMHALSPLLGMLQNQGRRVALVTDGRLSGASGKIPAVIHLTPEAKRGGPLARLREGDMIHLDGETGSLQALVEEEIWNERACAIDSNPAEPGLGRLLFGHNRTHVTAADQGALSISCCPALDDTPDAAVLPSSPARSEV